MKTIIIKKILSNLFCTGSIMFLTYLTYIVIANFISPCIDNDPFNDLFGIRYDSSTLAPTDRCLQYLQHLKEQFLNETTLG